MNDEIHQLEDFQKHPTWLQFVDAQKKQWQEELSQAIAHAANNANDGIAIGQIRQIVAAQQAILRALEWPKEQLTRLRNQEHAVRQEPRMARGGFR